MNTNKRKPYFNRENKILFLNRRQIPKHFRDKLAWSDYTDLNEYSMFACPISEEDSVKVDLFLKESTRIDTKELLKTELEIAYPHIDFRKILMHGNANQQRTSYRQFEFVIQYYYGKHPGTNTNADQHMLRLRSYERTYEDWVEVSTMVNLCSDDKMAWQTIIRKLGGHWVKGMNNTWKPFYIIVWAEALTEQESIDKHGV